MSSENELLPKEILEKDTLLANILRRISDAVVALDKDWRYTYVNEKAAELFGKTVDELVGKHIWTVFPEGVGQPFHLNYERAMREQKPFCFEDYYAPWDRWFENRLYPSPDGITIFFEEITARKKAEEEVRTYNQLLQTIINTAPVRVFWKDKDLRYLGCNTAFARDAGFDSPAEIIGKDDYQMGWREQAELYRADDRLTIDSGLPRLSYEEPQTKPDGSLVWIRTSKVPLKNQEDEVIGVLGVYEDITGRKKAEEKLREIEELFNLFMRHTPVYTFIKQIEGDKSRVIQLSDNFINMLGRPADELRGCTMEEMFPPDFARKITADDIAVVKAGRVIQLDEEFNGRSFVTIKFPIQREGRDSLLAGYTIDITERKQAEQAISKYADIVQHMQVGLYVYQLENSEDDRSLRMVAANPKSASLLGLTEGDIVGRTIDEIFPELRKSGIPGKFANVVRTGQAMEVEEFFYSDQNVKEAAFDFKVFPLPDKCVGVLFEDISLRKTAETALQNINRELEQRVEQRTAELKELNKELQAFNYSVSHDMRAPLIRINSYVDILFDSCAAKLSEEELHCISRLKVASHRLDEHIEALLKLYQIDRGDFYIEPVNLTDLSRKILHDLQCLDEDRRVTFTVADGMVLNADKMLMMAFLENLISNAWKYTAEKENARIEVGVVRRDGRELFFVRDNGAGFNMDQVENIFTPFVRLHKNDSGLGIGLASMQRIIHLHGGRIWAESKEGEGATFYFTLH